MRNPSEVAKQIKDIVPEEHKTRFKSLTKDFSYKPIEQRGECWSRLSLLCNELCGDLSEDWQIEMISILTMKSKEELIAARAWTAREERDDETLAT